MRKKILTIIGTRPNYIKITQLEREFARFPNRFDYRLLHTGQHFDKSMKDIFFQQLQLRKIDYALEVNHGTPGKQIGEIIIKIDAVLYDWKPDLIIVVGDVNSTLAAAIAANKANIKLAHIESGLRSNDRTMPEEFNRIVTDELSDLLFITEKSGEENLLKEGKNKEQIFFVGNTMIDTLVTFEKDIDQSPVINSLGINEKDYVLMTMHRPSNVDDASQLKKVFEVIELVGKRFKIIFPIHPRTKNNIERLGLKTEFEHLKNLILTEPLDYFSFQKLIKHAAMVITDSGGIQEETTFRKIPCLTLRENTERPSTIETGSNELLPLDAAIVKSKVESIVNGSFKNGNIPPLWDGKATERIVQVLLAL